MPFAVRNLSVLSYANGFTLWHYKAGEDSLARVENEGFFTAGGDLLSGGDILLVSSPEGASMLTVLPRDVRADEDMRTTRMC